MKNTLLSRLRFAVLISCLTTAANAATIHSNNAGTSTLIGPGYQGHSFTLGAGTSYDNITFSWISSNQSTLLAVGNLFILTQEFLGAPDNLSVATPGVLAESTGIIDSAYEFAPDVTLAASTQYFVYMGNAASLEGGGFTFSNPFAGGKAYEQFFAPAFNYVNVEESLDFNFVLSGTSVNNAVPEP